jgi:hypothetical protein
VVDPLLDSFWVESCIYSLYELKYIRVWLYKMLEIAALVWFGDTLIAHVIMHPRQSPCQNNIYFESYVTSEDSSGQGLASTGPTTYLLQAITKFPNLVWATIFAVTVSNVGGEWLWLQGMKRMCPQQQGHFFHELPGDFNGTWLYLVPSTCWCTRRSMGARTAY